MATWLVVYRWVDNNNQSCEHQMRAPLALSYGGVVSLATSLASAMEAVSSARLTGFTVERLYNRPTVSPISPDADCRTDAVLLYRNGDDTSSVRLPSPRPVLFEVSGPYAGLRITTDSALLSGLLPNIQALGEGTVDAVGRPTGTGFVVGGKLR